MTSLISLPLLPLLRVAPLTFSTALFVANLSQMHAFNAWLSPDFPSVYSAGKSLPHWFEPFATRMLPELGFYFLGAIFSGILNLYTAPTDAAWSWYAASLGFNLAHIVFSRGALTELRYVRKVEGAGEGNVEALRRWLRMNGWRFVFSEIPALFTAVVAVGLGMKSA